MTRIFIDGSSGTTGLRIHERLAARPELSLISLPESQRKDPQAKRDAMARSDVTFLCLPDAAAVEAAQLAEGTGTALIDTSTAHRTAEGWIYGFAELPGTRDAIRNSKRIANPGCHASGFIALVAPLVASGLLSPAEKLSCTSLTGYSGGGKKMIAQYEDPDRDALLEGPRQYGLTQNHKHLPEMQKICGLESAPIFCPIVAPFYAGMEVTVPLFREQLRGSLSELRQVYSGAYPGPVVRFEPQADEAGFLSASAFSGRDDMQITVCGNDERILLVARFDNLGKGASGAAIQSMNLLLGLDETAGLVIP
ncbi:MAG: N-acetyl-gamma-glutamyl-phosphate reductase [Oscillospiraceae bacterium]|nr:N-acetyl-gamma-glutamyl-phosphate reductase [Oscillospiraceae bacterium]